MRKAQVTADEVSRCSAEVLVARILQTGPGHGNGRRRPQPAARQSRQLLMDQETRKSGPN
ncbi:MAG TPA: hypothetical protein VKE24_09555 [Candidatus Acidoferrales bacterium]|nr:hypothetical protein [Candidatus Acidoferrales bacterium]